ncbi:hypothetical protein C0Q60_03520 [Streptomyces albidoflavus]|nr:hypothetical protein C0Q60_03520 [Streptomyces albidoflavus]RZE04952.1 hypothetical protein C0Q62_03435 [Streptomyces albidoflavus]
MPVTFLRSDLMCGGQVRSTQAQDAVRTSMLPHVHVRAFDPAQFSLASLTLAALHADEKFTVPLSHRLQQALDQFG